jgi:protein TonB
MKPGVAPALALLPAPRRLFGRALVVAVLMHLLLLLLPGLDLQPRKAAPVVLDLVLERVAERPPPPGQRATEPTLPDPARARPRDARAAEVPRREPTPVVAEPRRDRQRLNLNLAALDSTLAEQDAVSRIGRLTGGATHSAIEAAYLRAWRQRVERIGNANYPGGGVEGQLRLLVVINADGSLVDARLVTSSGVPALDAAALRIVRLSAPFPAFPVELRRRFDQLEILRSWQFTRRGARIER